MSATSRNLRSVHKSRLYDMLLRTVATTTGYDKGQHRLSTSKHDDYKHIKVEAYVLSTIPKGESSAMNDGW